jgi:hypothetical protein
VFAELSSSARIQSTRLDLDKQLYTKMNSGALGTMVSTTSACRRDIVFSSWSRLLQMPPSPMSTSNHVSHEWLIRHMHTATRQASRCQTAICTHYADIKHHSTAITARLTSTCTAESIHSTYYATRQVGSADRSSTRSIRG